MKVIVMPQKFDENEILIIFVGLVLAVFFLFTIKKFPIRLLIILLLINSYVGRSVDLILAIPPFNIYDSFDTDKYDLFDAITYWCIYPLYGYVFFYFYDKYTSIPTALYIIIWVVATTSFEWLSTLFNVFQYNKWSILLSPLVYLFVFLFHTFFFKWVSKQLNYSTRRLS